jgi:hypothetical protein
MRSSSPGRSWSRFLARLVVLLALLLWPWPGIGRSFAESMAGACDAAAGLVSGAGSEIHYAAPGPAPEHPWWMQMSVKNVFTGESFEVPVDTRTVAYVRIAVFVALSLAWPIWTSRRGAKATACAFGLLLATVALTLTLPLLQVMGMVRVLPLGVRTQSIISVGILSLVTYPSMAFAIPALLWWLSLRLGLPAASRARSDADASRRPKRPKVQIESG